LASPEPVAKPDVLGGMAGAPEAPAEGDLTRERKELAGEEKKQMVHLKLSPQNLEP
jgi:hypothetical protein